MDKSYYKHYIQASPSVYSNSKRPSEAGTAKPPFNQTNSNNNGTQSRISA